MRTGTGEYRCAQVSVHRCTCVDAWVCAGVGTDEYICIQVKVQVCTGEERCVQVHTGEGTDGFRCTVQCKAVSRQFRAHRCP